MADAVAVFTDLLEQAVLAKPLDNLVAGLFAREAEVTSRFA